MSEQRDALQCAETSFRCSTVAAALIDKTEATTRKIYKRAGLVGVTIWRREKEGCFVTIAKILTHRWCDSAFLMCGISRTRLWDDWNKSVGPWARWRTSSPVIYSYKYHQKRSRATVEIERSPGYPVLGLCGKFRRPQMQHNMRITCNCPILASPSGPKKTKNKFYFLLLLEAESVLVPLIFPSLKPQTVLNGKW